MKPKTRRFFMWLFEIIPSTSQPTMFEGPRLIAGFGFNPANMFRFWGFVGGEKVSVHRHEPGTNEQHAFYRLIHQRTKVVLEWDFLTLKKEPPLRWHYNSGDWRHQCH